MSKAEKFKPLRVLAVYVVMVRGGCRWFPSIDCEGAYLSKRGAEAKLAGSVHRGSSQYRVMKFAPVKISQ